MEPREDNNFKFDSYISGEQRRLVATNEQQRQIDEEEEKFSENTEDMFDIVDD